MSEKKRLGRGLGALIPEASSEADIREIAIQRIKPNPYQPRVSFDETKLRELADSIEEHGVVQAVVVSPDGNNYVLVAGERRFRAAKMVGLQTIPAVVRELNRSAMLEIALIENLQREDLNPIEEATAYRRLMDEFNLTQEELARRVGKSRSTIANTVRLLSLSKSVLEALIRGDISAGQARPLLGLSERETQDKVALQIMAKGLTARDVEKMVARMGKAKEEPSEHLVLPADPLHKEIQEQLQRRLGTKVKINRGKLDGSLEIFFYSDEDLERLLALLLPEGIF
jgi:ParB family transcriptional regulator, chromosome partitioning protein